jgi:anti-sigma B factor antagonist
MQIPVFEVQASQREDTTVLTIVGELDIATVDQFSRAVDAALSQSRRVEIDLAALEFVDSSGLRAIVAIHNASKAEGFAYKLRGSTPRIQRLFTLTGLDDLLDLA